MELTLLKKGLHYYRRYGLLASLRRVPTKLRWTVFRKRDIVYVCELRELTSKPLDLPDQTEIERIERFEQLSSEHIKALCEDQSPQVFTDQLRYRLDRGSILWLMMARRQPAGLFWTISGGSLRPHYFCLTEHDAHLYDGRILKTHRGRGLFPVLTVYILQQLLKEGLSRAYVETNAANLPAIRAFDKCPLRQIATARKYRLFGRNITLWNRQEPTS